MCRVVSSSWAYTAVGGLGTSRRLTNVSPTGGDKDPEAVRYAGTTMETARKYVAVKWKLRTGLRPEVGQWWKTNKNSSIRSQRKKILRMSFDVSPISNQSTSNRMCSDVSAPFRTSTVRDAARGHPSRSTVALCSIKKHPFTAEIQLQPPFVEPSMADIRYTAHAMRRDRK